MAQEKSLKELQELEEAATGTNQETVIDDASSYEAPKNKPNVMDGFVRINREDLPQQGSLYPESWEFAYRCPTSKEVANFSTINEQDQPAIIVAVEDLIRKCVIIYDTEQDKQINTGEICDGHRTFFLLLLRDFYLPGNPIQFRTICQTDHETWDATLTAKKLQYPELKERLLNDYDGRIFSLDMGIDTPIRFRVPTLETTGRIFKYIVKVYRNASTADNEKKEDNVIYDKQFLLVAPYLFESGRESIREITFKYKAIQKNEEVFKKYLEIINRLKLDNEETFIEICPSCGSEEETMIKFPGGWKKLFVAKTDTTGYFD